MKKRIFLIWLKGKGAVLPLRITANDALVDKHGRLILFEGFWAPSKVAAFEFGEWAFFQALRPGDSWDPYFPIKQEYEQR